MWNKPTQQRLDRLPAMDETDNRVYGLIAKIADHLTTKEIKEKLRRK